MHRSGTSSVAGAFVHLGGRPPCHLIPAAPDNARGFWESTIVTALNDEILVAGGSDWKDWRRFDASRIDAAEAKTLRKRAKVALVTEFAWAGIPVVKDPRMCRLMGFWRPVFQELAWSPRVVLPIRSPLEVAWSLRRRDGLGVSAGCLLWLRHVLDAEADTRGMKRAVLDWSRLLEDWPASLGPVIERLDMDWVRFDSQSFAEVEDFLSPNLRRFIATAAELDADPAVAALVREVYASLLDLTVDTDNVATLLRLDALRARFEDAVVTFDPVMREQERAENRCQELEAQVRAMESEYSARLAEAEGRARQRDEALTRANAVIARYVHGRPNYGLHPPLRSRRLPKSVNRRELRIIRNSPFFDEAFYLEANPGVRAARCDAALHYLLQGWREGRDPGRFFSTTDYLGRNPDVAAAGVNPLIHYESCGRNEGRLAIS